MTSWAYADTAAISSEFRQSLLTVGLFVTGVAAFTGSGISRPNLAFAAAGMSRRGAPLAISHVSFTYFCAALGYTVGLAVPVANTILSSDYGSVDVLTVISGYVSLFFYVAFGYLVGCLLPNYVAVPAVLLSAYLLLFFSPAVLSPVFTFDIISGQRVPDGVTLIRILFYSATSVACVAAASTWLRRRTTTDRRAAIVGVLAILAPLVVVAASARSSTAPLVAYDDATPSCRTGKQLAVCVHPAREDLLDPWFEGVAEIQAAGGDLLVPDVVVADATLNVDPSDTFVIQIQGQDRERWLSYAIADVVNQITGGATCLEGGLADSASSDVSNAVGAWLLKRAGQDPLPFLQTPEIELQYSRLEGFDSNEVLSLIEANRDTLMQCRLQSLDN